eukprot:1400305-Pleurochrysis_carterae.AAC.1
MNEELHTPFDDSNRSNRIEAGAKAQKAGRAWVTAIRAHAGDSVTHNYMHLSFAHLAELIARHGMLSRCDDVVLERDNRTAKRIKGGMLFWGGSSDPDKSTVERSEFREWVDANGEGTGETYEVVSERQRNAGQADQFGRLMVGRKTLLSERKAKRKPASRP